MNPLSRLASLFSFKSKPLILSPEEFTIKYVKAVKSAYPDMQVDVLEDLVCACKQGEDQQLTSNLHNAYNDYRQAPEELENILAVRVGIYKEHFKKDSAVQGVDLSLIVPIIKDRQWFEDVTKGMPFEKAGSQPYFQALNSELIILYAVDAPNSLRYIRVEEMGTNGLDPATVRDLAIANLKRVIPEVKCMGADGVYMFTAGGTFESSLLLFDNIWRSGQLEVKGELIVALPSRDMLLVTGSEDELGLEKVRQIVTEIIPTASYRLTDQFFVYREGKFELFEQGRTNMGLN